MAANPESGAAPSVTAQRLRELAAERVHRLHDGALEDECEFTPGFIVNGHSYPMAECQHPDCVLVRSPEEPAVTVNDVDLQAYLETLFTVTAAMEGQPFYVTFSDVPRGELMSVLADDDRDSATSWREQIIDALNSALWFLLKGVSRSPEETQEPRTEKQIIEHCRSHWFAQGGEMQFGAIPECDNPDMLISEILSVVRARLAALSTPEAQK